MDNSELRKITLLVNSVESGAENLESFEFIMHEGLGGRSNTVSVNDQVENKSVKAEPLHSLVSSVLSSFSVLCQLVSVLHFPSEESGTGLS